MGHSHPSKDSFNVSWEGLRGSWEGLGVSESASEAAGRALGGKGGRSNNENKGNKVNGEKISNLLNGGIIGHDPVQGHCPKIKAI